MKSKENKKSELSFIDEYKTIAITMIIIVIFMYMLFIGIVNDKLLVITDLGAIGDFFGGLLNPTFSLLALFALLATIKIQSKALKVSSDELVNSRKELEYTRKELSRSASAQEEQSESIKLQNDYTKQQINFQKNQYAEEITNKKTEHGLFMQNQEAQGKLAQRQSFEETFFKMLNIHTNIVNSLQFSSSLNRRINDNIGNYTVQYTLYRNPEAKGQEIIGMISKDFDELLKNHSNLNITNQVYLLFHEKIEEVVGHYFRNIYQVLKYIKTNEIENKKFYSNLFRAQFTKGELKLLFYNCISDIGNEKFLPLLIEFEFLEHLPYTPYISYHDVAYCTVITKQLNDGYEVSKIFGSNTIWKEKTIKHLEHIENDKNAHE